MDISVDELMLLAVDAHSKGRYSEVEILYRKILGQDPDNVDCLNNLGSIIGGDEAVSFFKKAVSLAPAFPNSYVNLGREYAKQELWNEAALCFEQAQENGQNSVQDIEEIIDKCRRNAIFSAKENCIQLFPWTAFSGNPKKTKKKW